MTKRKSRGKHELTLLQVSALAFITAILVSIVLGVCLINIVDSPEYQLFKLQSPDNPISPSNEVFLRFKNLVAMRETFIFNPIVHAISGGVIGLLASRSTARKSILAAAGIVSLFVSLCALSTQWGASLYAQHWHLRPYQLTEVVVAKQTEAVAFWAVTAILASAGAVLLRRSVKTPTHSTPKVPVG